MRRILVAAAGALFVPLFASPQLEAQQVKSRLCGGRPMPAIPAEATREARRQGHRATPGLYRCDPSGWVFVPSPMIPNSAIGPAKGKLEPETRTSDGQGDPKPPPK